METYNNQLLTLCGGLCLAENYRKGEDSFLKTGDLLLVPFSLSLPFSFLLNLVRAGGLFHAVTLTPQYLLDFLGKITLNDNLTVFAGASRTAFGLETLLQHFQILTLTDETVD